MRSKIILFVLFVVISFLALAPDAHAQLGTIRGEIKDEEGNPIPDVTVRIEGLNVKRNYRVKTDKEGKYFHGGVSFQSRYRVIAQKDGFQSTYAEGIQPAYRGGMSERRRGVADFTMKRGASGVLAFELSDEKRKELMAKAEENKRELAEQAKILEGVKQALNRGLTLYNNERYDMALHAFKEGVELDDQQPAVWARLGNTYSKLEQYDQAVDAYVKAVALSPEDAALYQNLGGIYAAKGDSEKAREAYDKAASLTSDEDPTAAATNYYNMGVTYINSGRTQEAIEQLQKALEIDPTHAQANYQLGISMLGLPNRIEQAVEHLKKYVELEPDGPDVETAKALIQELGK